MRAALLGGTRFRGQRGVGVGGRRTIPCTNVVHAAKAAALLTGRGASSALTREVRGVEDCDADFAEVTG
jgi:hypothetical protein